jgi:thiamine-monophosphate kinase
VRQLRPEPRLRLGQLASRFASACLDLSDGLGQDLRHLCEASRVGARVELSRLPVGPGPAAESAQRALTGGEDYELLLAIPPRRQVAFERACARAGEPVTRVGHLTRERAVLLLDPAGRRFEGSSGFDHFGGKD